MRRLSIFAGLVSVLLSSSSAGSAPARFKRVPLSFTGVDILQDAVAEDVYYILPSELVVDASRFSSRSSYAWRLRADGTATVQVVARMYSADDLVMQATREINQDTGRRVRYRGLEVRNPRVTIFEDPALISAVDATLSTNADGAGVEGSSFSKVALRFHLTKEGAVLWKRAIRSGVLLVTGSLAFEFEVVDASGGTSFVPVEIPLTVRNLPDPDQPLDTRRALTSLATQRGEQYFYGQYTTCRAFFEDVSFRAPGQSELESDDSLLSAEERALYARIAASAFVDAVQRQRALCADEVERMRGEHWMRTILTDRGFTTCHHAESLPPWSEFFFAIQTNAPSYVSGAQRSYDDYRSYCATPIEVSDLRVNMSGDCVRNVAVSFSEKLDADTFAGNIVVYASDIPSNRFSGVTLEKVDADVIVFRFETPLCRETRDYIIELTASLRGVSGRRLSRAFKHRLDFAPRDLLRLHMQPATTPGRMCTRPGDVMREPSRQSCSVKAVCTAKQGGITFLRELTPSGAVTRAALSDIGACVDVGDWLAGLSTTAMFEGCEAEVRCRD